MGCRELSVSERTAMTSCGVLCRRDPTDLHNDRERRGVRVPLAYKKKKGPKYCCPPPRTTFIQRINTIFFYVLELCFV